MTFAFPALAVAGVALAAAPIVVHLIHLRRRRTVAWAAMDFLLASDRRRRRWSRLSEWLLLAARVVAVLLAGLLAAAPRTAGVLDGFFAPTPALHAVLLDDTASMQRRAGGRSAWDEATAAVTRLAQRAAASGDTVVVVRCSDSVTGAAPMQVVRGAPGGDPAAWQPTYLGGTLTDAFPGFRRAIENAPRGSRRVAYVFSDFAGRTGDDPAGEAALRELSGDTAGLALALCGDPATANLSIDGMTLAEGPVAAGVEARLVIDVTNHSDAEVPPVTVAVRRDGRPIAAVEVGPLDPRGTRRAEAPIVFLGEGAHTVEAELPADGGPADDRRWLGVDCVAAHGVLLVDDSERRAESRVFAAALRPAGVGASGWSPRAAQSVSAEGLADAPVVAVLDVERLDATATAALREHVQLGGGLLVVPGPRLDAAWVARLLGPSATGDPPLLPWAVGPPSTAPAAAGLSVVRDHAAVRSLATVGEPLLALARVAIHRPLTRLDADADTPRPRPRQVSADRSLQAGRLVSLADGSPLLVAERMGAGRVAVLGVPAAAPADGSPAWSNLASLPIFPVLLNDLVGWLAEGRLAPAVEEIGSVTGRANAQAQSARSTLVSLAAGGATAAEGLGPAAPLAPATPGVFRRVIDRVESRAFAAVVPAGESDLEAAGVGELRSCVGGAVRVARADDLFRDGSDRDTAPVRYAAATVFLTVLIAERLLALHHTHVGSAAPLAGRVP